MFRIDFNTLINVQERKKLQGAYKPNKKYTNKKNINKKPKILKIYIKYNKKNNHKKKFKIKNNNIIKIYNYL